MKIGICFAALLLLFSCNLDKNTQDKDDDHVTWGTDENLDSMSNQVEAPKELLPYFSFKRELILKNLEGINNPKEADKLFLKFRKSCDSVISILTKQEAKYLDSYYELHFDLKGGKRKLNAKYETLEQNLKQAKIQTWEIGEGFVEFRIEPDYYLKLFGKYVSEDFQAYLKITSQENKTLFSADAGLSISFNELGKRILKNEKFLAKYPNFKLKNEVKANYLDYQLYYIIGMDNTPRMDYETNDFYPETLQDFNLFMKENPTSQTTILLKKVLDEKPKIDRIYEYIKVLQS